MGVMHPGLIMKCESHILFRTRFSVHFHPRMFLLAAIIPVVMAGVIGIYGFIIAVVVGTKSKLFLTFLLVGKILIWGCAGV
jgi:ABC-type microcin C transport system permease subunit YejE